jgi:hypothetical protein
MGKGYAKTFPLYKERFAWVQSTRAAQPFTASAGHRLDLRSQSKAVRPSVLFDAQLVATPRRPADLLQKDVPTITCSTPREKPYRLFDQQGLYLEVSPRGNKWWRVKYRFGQRENRLSVDTFPEVSVKAARGRCREIRAQVAAGIDPSAQRKKAKQRPKREVAIPN